MSHRVDRKIDLFDKSVVALDFVYREALVREDEVRETVVTRQPHDPVGLDLECIGRNAGAAPGRPMEIIREMQECDREWACMIAGQERTRFATDPRFPMCEALGDGRWARTRVV